MMFDTLQKVKIVLNSNILRGVVFNRYRNPTNQKCWPNSENYV